MQKRTIQLPKTNSFFLFGARQTGKTTIVTDFLQANGPYRTYNLLQSETYFALEQDPGRLRREIEKLPASVQWIFIDEVQRVPQLLNEVHSIIEEGKRGEIPTRLFAMTGSSARKLKRAKANLLAGRAWRRHLHPFTYEEIGANFNLEKVLALGTLPGVYLASTTDDAMEILRSYVETYLHEEIEAEALVRNLGAFLRFLPIAADTNGKIVNFSNIASSVGSTHTTIKEFFAILQDTLVGRLLPSFSFSTRKRLRVAPKFYFFDGGVQRTLLKRLSLSLEPNTWEYGNAFEAWLVNETFRLLDYYNPDFELSYFRTEGGAEIDLIIRSPRGEISAIEFKATTNPEPQTYRKGFQALESILKPANKLLVCNAAHQASGENCDIAPWADYLNWLKNLLGAPTSSATVPL